MTKKVRQQIDVSNIFIEANINAASKVEIQRLDAWPILVAIHVLSEGKAKISQLNYPTVHNYDHYEVHMMTDTGQSIASVTRGVDKVFTVYSADSPYGPGQHLNGFEFTRRIESKNVRYIVKKLGESSNHDVYICIHHALNRAATGLGEMVRGLLGDSFYAMTGKYLHRSIPSLSDSNGNYALLLRHFMGEVKREELSLETVRKLDSDYKRWLDESNALRTALERFNTVFSHDKWLVMPQVNGGVIVGALSFHPLQSAVREAANDNGLLPSANNFNYVQEVVPFKWYKSFDSIPEGILAELNLSALMLKAHTGSEELFPRVERDKVYEDIEVVTYRTNNIGVYMLNK